MLRHMIRCGRKLSFSKNSRSLQTSIILSSEKKDNEKDEEKFDEKYWSTECEEENPLGRTYRVMAKQCRQMRNKVLFWRDPTPIDRDDWRVDSADFPSHVDVLIIGSGAIADSIALWMRKKGGESFTTVVIDKDDMYSSSSPILHAPGLRMQNGLEVNIQMALFGAEFLREANHHLAIEGQPPIKIKFHHHGFLNLATEAGAEQLMFNSKMQNSMNIMNTILSPEALKLRFPWLNTDGIALGCLGLEGEGYYDPGPFLAALKNKATALGVEHVVGEVKGFIFSRTPNTSISSEYKQEMYRKLNHAVVRTADGEKKVVQFAILVIAAGHESLKIAEMLHIGKSSGILSVPLPLESRKRYLYSIHAPDGPGLNTPMIQDPSGFYMRRDGLANHYSIGFNPVWMSEEPTPSNLQPDSNYFYNTIWPNIAQRIPSLQEFELKSSQAAYLDYNRYDESGILGTHPLYTNVVFATGFGYNSINFAPAIGRAVSEMIWDTSFSSIDMTPLGFERFITQEPHIETRII